MIGVYLASLLSMNGQASSVSALLASPLASAHTSVLFPLGRIRDLGQSFSNEKDLLRSEQIQGDYRGKGFLCYQWDSRELLPMIPNLDATSAHGKTMTAFEGLFSDQRDDLFSRLIEGNSALMNELPKGRMDALVDTLPNYSNEIKQSIKSGGGEIRATFQPKLILQGSNGEHLADIDLSKCPSARKALAEIFGEAPEQPPVPRCPETLLRSFDPDQGLAVDGVRVFRVEELVAELRKGTHLPLYADRRILTKRIAIRANRIEYGKLAEALPTTLDMYWRPVGSVWFLAISPGDPLKEANLRSQRMLQESTQRVAGRLAQAGYLPGVAASNGFLGREVNLSNLTGGQARAFTDLLVTCADDSKRKLVSDALRSRRLSDLKLYPALGVDINLSVSGENSWFSAYVQYP